MYSALGHPCLGPTPVSALLLLNEFKRRYVAHAQLVLAAGVALLHLQMVVRRLSHIYASGGATQVGLRLSACTLKLAVAQDHPRVLEGARARRVDRGVNRR